MVKISKSTTNLRNIKKCINYVLPFRQTSKLNAAAALATNTSKIAADFADLAKLNNDEEFCDYLANCDISVTRLLVKKHAVVQEAVWYGDFIGCKFVEGDAKRQRELRDQKRAIEKLVEKAGGYWKRGGMEMGCK